jgi:formylglycine-generating enzyme required for sulfatase activity/DNA polymerase III delta prime subunit
MSELTLPSGFRPDQDLLLEVLASETGGAERARLFGGAFGSFGSDLVELDWAAACDWLDRSEESAAGDSTSGFLETVECIRRAADGGSYGSHSSGNLGRAIASLIPEAWRTEIAACRGRWVLDLAGTSAALIPWEAIFVLRPDGRRFDPVSMGRLRAIRLLRNCPEPAPIDPVRARLLILVGDSEQQGRTLEPTPAILEEVEAIERGADGFFQEIQYASSTGTLSLSGTRPRRLRKIASREDLERLLGEGFQAIHYVGHSQEDSNPVGGCGLAIGLRFGGGVGDVSASDLARMLRHRSTRLLVLNACNAPDVLAQTLGEACSQVVAIGAKVTFEVLSSWSQGFYGAVFRDHRPISEAVAAGRMHLAETLGRAMWLPCHWSADLTAHPLPSKEDLALWRYRQQVRSDHGSYFRSSDKGSRLPFDAIHELAIDLDLELKPGYGPARGAGVEKTGRDRVIDLIAHPERFTAHLQPKFLLEGSPGAGKSTSLRRLARQLADGGLWVPWYQPLPQWPRSEQGKHLDFWQLVTDPDLAAVLRQAAANGRLVLLLDSLDECQDLNATCTFVAGPLVQGNCPVIVATRKAIAADQPIPRGFERVSLAPLSRELQSQLLLRYFAGLGIEAAETGASDLLAHMQRSRALREAAEVPLYLTLAADLWINPKRTAELEGEPHKLYEQFTDWLLMRPYAEERPADSASKAVPVPLLRSFVEALCLAWTLDPEVDAHFSLGWIDSLAKPLGAREEPSPGRSLFERDFEPELLELRRKWNHWAGIHRYPHELAVVLSERTGLIRSDQGRRLWSFPHQTFREALAARALARIYGIDMDPGNPSRTKLNGLLDFLGRALEIHPERSARISRWNEVLVLLTGWIRDEEKDRWLRWLGERLPTVALRALAFGPAVRPETIVEILGLGADRSDRIASFDRALGVTDLAPEKLDTLAALISALARRAPGREAEPLATERVFDLAYLDRCLEELAEQHPDQAARAREVRFELLRVLPTPSKEDLELQFTRVMPERTSVRGEHRSWLAAVPSGTFTQGSPEDEGGRKNENQVQRTVAEFAMARVPVTAGQYRLFDPAKYAPDHDGRLPATSVSWFEAMLFTHWLDHHGDPLKAHAQGCSSWNFRLPFEAEWEWAGRDAPGPLPEGQRGYPRFAIGNSEAEHLALIAWYGGNSGNKVRPVATTPGGASAPSLGLYDMLGNVWEWCRDPWVEHPQAGEPAEPALGPRDSLRVRRGGSAWVDAWNCRVGFRVRWVPVDGLVNFGFRVVLAPRSESVAR